MAEQDPPAARVDVSGRTGRRRKARKGKSRSSGPDTAKAKARPPGGAAEAGGAPREEKTSGSQASPRQPESRRAAARKRGSRKGAARSSKKPRAQGEAVAAKTVPAEAKTVAPGFPAASFVPAGFTPVLPGANGPSSRPSYRQSYAAIDLGTNNCRLLIARPSGENFTVIDAFSRVVRLGEGLAQSGRLSEAAMDRTLAALRVCAEKLMRRNVYLARSVATEACRRAENGPEFIERVREETGIALDIISAREEARLAVLGCHVLLEEGFGPAMIFDIGGGSTELVLIESTGTVPRILDWQSVPWGVVSLTESCGPEGTTLEERLARYRHMHGLVSESFSAFAKRVGPARGSAAETGPLRLLGTSGTVTTLASLHLELPQYDRRMVDGLIVPAESMRDISSRLSSMSIEERREVNCIGRERADLVVAGCAILESILDLWPAARLGVADRGIREGILRSLIASHSSGRPTVAPAPSHLLENRP
ncbi:exopolyphosphatase/guanosine-5'-triphosphate,3'-diphosphate pyrophosphatase [Novosphingobium sp. PhB57]|uniref:Ppx/GppA phosphatase family protein n=1 Tax=unclassified Novosphingobium TaxID=2644732 RepID=UPI00104DE94A|nr:MULTISPECIES: Ppx/GppA phosphatase family protein [unclassified Novosphingobium]TCU59493.1 exopolyphosphatase/guanosine-5'-triphosphate,3'-diphosphate pyrophosphatase [Novosphingobium sp. PhB57]TDW63854.1 exopolyphosphatase/guanosine-5'-triphosphate,3'-diphosphate pyrophosphatase [Novosphingobium sp. PhB55]